MSRPTVVLELAENPRFVEDVNAGGVFVPGCALEVQAECDLVVRAPTGEMTLPARVVYVDPATGCGLELIGVGPTIKERLAVQRAVRRRRCRRERGGAARTRP